MINKSTLYLENGFIILFSTTDRAPQCSSERLVDKCKSVCRNVFKDELMFQNRAQETYFLQQLVSEVHWVVTWVTINGK